MKIINLIGITLLLLGCVDSGPQQLFLRVEQLMDSHPDSALTVLKEINSTSLGEEDNARYALLYTQALDKNERDATSDSLISIAVNYYSDRKNSPELAKSHYYQGIYYITIGLIREAVDKLLDAGRVAASVGEDNLLGLIYGRLAILYVDQDETKKALEAYSMSGAYFNKVGNIKNESGALLGKGRTFLFTRQYDSVAYYLDKAAEQGDVLLQSKVLNLKGYAELQQGNVQRGKQLIRQSIRLMGEEVPLNFYAALSDAFLMENNLDSARYWVNAILQGKEVSGKALAGLYHRLYNIERMAGDYKAACEYLKKVYVMTDSIHREERNQSVLVFFRKYNYEHEKSRVIELRLLIARLWLVIAVVIIVGGACLWRKQRLLCERTKESEVRGAEVKVLNKRLADQKSQDEKLREQVVKYSALISDMLLKQPEEKGKDLTELESCINLLNGNFVDHLRQTFPQLKEEELKLCYLVVNGLTTKEIGHLLGKTDSTIDNWRCAITTRLFPDGKIRFNDFIKSELKQAESGHVNNQE